MQPRDNLQEILIIVSCATILLSVFCYLFKKRKYKTVLNSTDEEGKYILEVTRAKLEIQRNLLRNVSWELHDNIGQLLSTAHLELSILADGENTGSRDTLSRIRELVFCSLQEIRSVSRIIKNDVVEESDLLESIKNDLSRFRKLNYFETEFLILGNPWILERNDTVFLLGIIQDFFNYSVRCAKAGKITVILVFSPNDLQITLFDDGLPAIPDKEEYDSELSAFKKTAELIDLQIKKGSVFRNRRKLKLTYPRKNIPKVD